ncbi:MAG: hypothetical protein QOG54_839 [Actinomycetota bacterium]|jgi:hypothetical protein|nr:hypothetical protein [Actinomycetota bacterium]
MSLGYVALGIALVLASTSSVPGLAKVDRGGRTAVHEAGGKPISDSKIKRDAPVSHMFRIDHGAGEPTLGINKAGTIFITASDGCVTSCTGSEEMADTVTPGGRDVFASTDNGKSWVAVAPKVGPATMHLLTMDPYFYIDESTDRIFDIDLTVACSILSYSDNGGQSWITNPIGCGEPINDHQTVFAGPPVSSPTVGYPNIVYYCFNHPAFTKCNKSLDGGLSFIPTANILPIDCSGLNGHGVTDKQGTVYIPLGSNCGEPNLAISKDEGDNWDLVRVSKESLGGGDPSVAIDEQGNLYYLYVDAATKEPHLTTSTDGGKTWSDPVNVAPRGMKATNLATIDVGDPGNVAIAYYGSTTDGRWNGYMATGYDVLSSNAFFYTASVNDPLHPLKMGQCGPGRCGRVLDFIDVEISPKGVPWGAFVDACLDDCEKANQENIHDNQAVVGTLTGGPKLR